MPNLVGSSTSFSSIRESRFSFVNFSISWLKPFPMRLSPRHIMKLSLPRNFEQFLRRTPSPRALGVCR